MTFYSKRLLPSIGVRLLIIILFICPISSAFGQESIELFQLYGQFSPNVEFEEGTGQSDVNEFGVRFRRPFKIGEKSYLVPGIFMEQLDSRLSSEHSKNTFVYTISPRIGLQTKHSEKWSGSYLLIPRISSDLSGFDSDDLQLGGLFLLNYTKSSNKKYQVGAYYNTELFGPVILPLFGFYYISENKKFEADVLAPVAMDINYELSTKVKVGISFWAKGSTFNLHDYGEDEGSYYLEKRSADLFSYVDYSFSKGWAMQVMLGQSFSRIYEVYAGGDKVDLAIGPIKVDDDRMLLNIDLKDSILLKFKLIYRISLTKT